MNAGQYSSMAQAIIGTGAAALAATYGINKSGELNYQADQIRRGMQNDNREWYNVKMSQDYTQRADVQAAIKKQRELLNEQYKRSKATNAVAGGTDESLALQKQGANQSVSQTASEVAARGADYKDNVERQFRSQDFALKQQEAQDKKQRAAAVAQAASQVVNTGLQMVGSGVQGYANSAGNAKAMETVMSNMGGNA